jgi:hypothetical protein
MKLRSFVPSTTLHWPGRTLAARELVGEHLSSRHLAFRPFAYSWRVLGLVTALADVHTNMDRFVNLLGRSALGQERGLDAAWVGSGRWCTRVWP